mgnify:CR=1 FL=1
MTRRLIPDLYNSKLLKFLLLISCIITSCYSYNPIYNQPSKSSLNPKLEYYTVSFDTEIDSSLLLTSKEKLVDFILSDINSNIITKGTESEEPSGNIYLRINYNYENGIGSLSSLAHIGTMGMSIALGVPFMRGTLELQAEVEIYDENGNFSYYETFTNNVKWKKSLYFQTHYSAGSFIGGYQNGIDKKVLNNMVYKATNDFLMDLKKQLGRNFNLESINKKTQKNIDRDVSTLNKKKSKKHLSFQSSDSTFSINSIAVIPKEIKSCSGNILSADELAAYTETHILSHYNVTDRRHLKAILDEQRLQMSGLTFEETVLESGCIANAQAYLFVREGCLKGDEIIELRLVHCETSTLLWSCTGINASLQEVLARINEELSS